MRLAMLFCLGIFVLAQPRLARPQDADNPLRFYTVHIGAGYGVYLGNGIVITVAHVTDLEPRVNLAGRELPAKVLKRDSDADLALLSIDKGLPARLGLHNISLCQNSAEADEPVLVAIPEGVARSYVLSPFLLPPNIPAKFRTAIRNIDFANSGTGIFDASKKCLLGIISQKITITLIKQVGRARGQGAT